MYHEYTMKKLSHVTALGTILAIALFGASCSQIAQTNRPNLPATNMPSARQPNQPEQAKPPVADSATLNLSNNNLTKLPAYVLGMTQLRELNLAHNQLTGALPGEIRFLKNLQKLNLSYNDMTGVPAEVGQLTELKELDLSYNRFTGLPNELGNLRNLKILNLTGNDYAKQDLEGIQAKLPNLRVIK